MTTIPIIPENLAAIAPLLNQYLAPLLLWVSDLIYQRLQPLFSDHPLIRLATLLDLRELEQACADYHSPSHYGRPVEHSVPQLVRAIVVRYYYNESLRQTAARIREQIPAKWFVGYPLASPGPSYSCLHRFESYLIEQHPRLFFDTILKQIRATHPQQQAQPQLADTFAVLADGQQESLIGRLRHGAARLLLAIHQQAPDAWAACLSQVDVSLLLGQEGEKYEFLLDATTKAARLQQTVTQLLPLLAVVATHWPTHDEIKRYSDWLQALLTKEVGIDRDETGAITHVRQLAVAERGTFCPTTATDLDATCRNHGPHKVSNGYNAHILTATDFIYEIQATTGATADATGVVPLLQAQADHHDYWPSHLVYDRAAGDGHTIAAVHRASEGQTQLVVQPVQRGQSAADDRFGPLDCTLTDTIDPTTGELVPTLHCPAGQATTTRYRSGSGLGWTYRIPAATCAACPLLLACRGTAVAPARYRQWFISDYRAPLLAAIAYTQTDAFRAAMRLRPQVERIIAGLVLHNGARRARFRGLAKVDYQLKMNALAYNLKRWLVLTDPNRPPPRPRGSAIATVRRLVAGTGATD